MEETKMANMKVKITLLEDMLGTAPNNKEIYTDYLASKAPEGKNVKDEIDSIEEPDGIEEMRQMTIFHRNPDTNQPIIFDYLVKGFFKNACSAMREVPKSESSKIKAYKKKIDNLVFVAPRMIDIDMAGEMTICERPLRAQTAQGERVALSCSESIPAGSTMEIEITTLTDDLMNTVIEWLDYGKLNGLGQWHNSGKGRFSWEDITDKQ